MRTAKIELLGKTYMIAYSAQSQMNVEAFRRREGFNARDYASEVMFNLLAEELRAGYNYARLTGETAEKPPEPQALADLLTPQEVQALMPTLTEVMNGERNVQAKPPKKASAGQSGE